MSVVQRWKTGKRKAEKDEYLGGKMFITVRTPSHPVDLKAAYVCFCFDVNPSILYHCSRDGMRLVSSY